MTNEEWLAFVEETGSVFELLFRTARRVNTYALTRIEQESGQAIRESHTALFPHLSVEGVRITEIAQILGVTKQAIAKRVDELEEMGVVERIPDPEDGRAKLVRVIPAAFEDGLMRLLQIERMFAEQLGADRMREFSLTLRAVLNVVEQHES